MIKEYRLLKQNGKVLSKTVFAYRLTEAAKQFEKIGQHYKGIIPLDRIQEKNSEGNWVYSYYK